jgi:HrpA-like RNA helicase
MVERGESLPERCKTCSENHRKEQKRITIPYFQAKLESESNFTVFDYYQSAYTFHGNRPRRVVESKADISEVRKRIKITDEHIERLFEILKRNQVVILTSPTGTGKSTYVLYRLIDPLKESSEDFTEELIRQGQIIQTQPLSSATERIPNTTSKKLLGESGAHETGALGLRHRGNERFSRHNIGLVVTDGSLRNWIRDGRLDQYSLVMIDETHKRTLNIESILLLLKYMLPLYPHLKVIISSATIDAGIFLEALKKEGISAEIFDLSKELEEKRDYFVHFWGEGRVEGCDCWLCQKIYHKGSFFMYEEQPPDISQLSEIASEFIIEILKNLRTGEGILVFFPGQKWIEEAKELLEERKKEIDPKNEIEIIPVYRKLGEEKVTNNFNKRGKKGRVLLATDIAETSHTLEDIVYVVDSGYIREIEWDPETMTSYLPVKLHSKAGCYQRWGRVGRVKKGYVYCLFTTEKFENEKEFKEQTVPEIYRNRLDDVILTLLAGGIPEISKEILIEKDEREKEKINSEIKRALFSLKEIGLLDETGNVTEKGLEAFHFPEFSSEEKSLLDLADEQNCLLEMLIAILMMRTEEGEVRTGARLYSESGLFMWDSKWSAETKMKVWKIHQALKTGCKDDLDFVIKLAYCFLESEKKGAGKEWAESHFINYNVLEEIFSPKKGKFYNLIERFRVKAEEREIRDIDFTLLERVRSVFAIVLKSREFEVTKDLTYNLLLVKGKNGIISKNCAGAWLEGKKGLMITATKEEVIVEGRKELIPSASFIIKLPDLIKPTIKEHLLIDQSFPINSIVSVKEKNGKFYLEKVIKPPPSIKIKYKKILGYLGKEEKEAEEIFFNEKFITPYEGSDPIEGIWISKEKNNTARIIGWIEKESIPIALISAYEKVPALSLSRGEKLKVKICQVFRDPIGKDGWIEASTDEGFEIPIELSEMSLNPFGYGLELIKEENLSLFIKDFDEDGMPQLSNIANIINDLRALYNQQLISEVLPLIKERGEEIDQLFELFKNIRLSL